MRTRTAYCRHGFQIPGLPEPWTTPRNVCVTCREKSHTDKQHPFIGGAEIKASRFCLKCWDCYAEDFLARGYARIETEDPVTYGFLDLLQKVLRVRAWYRDQDRYEFLETELRMHLLKQRDLIEQAIRKCLQTARAYVLTALRNKLQDLQKDDKTEFQVERNSDPLPNECGHDAGSTEPDSDITDENQIVERIADATGTFDATVYAEDKPGTGSIKVRSARAAQTLTATQLTESERERIAAKDPLKTKRSEQQKHSRKKENAELVRAAIEEQGHRLDALTLIEKKEWDYQVQAAHKQLLAAVQTLPRDEQTVIRLRFMDGNGLRDGRPRPRQDILSELRMEGNGSSGWSEWDLRTLERQAVIRLRQKVKLPAIFNDRD